MQLLQETKSWLLSAASFSFFPLFSMDSYSRWTSCLSLPVIYPSPRRFNGEPIIQVFPPPFPPMDLPLDTGRSTMSAKPGPMGDLTQVSSLIAGATTYKAFYFHESADTDSDGIKDWFEYRMWGDLTNGPIEDPDGDGFNLREDPTGTGSVNF